MGRRALVLAIALLLGAVAAFAVWRYLSGIESEIRANTEQVVVFRAVAPIIEGTTGAQVLQTGAAAFTEGVEQREDLPEDYIGSQEQLTAVLQTRVAVGPISRNGILTTSQWAELSVELTPLTELIDEGLEAVTVAPDSTAGVNGFVLPGDRVNILVTIPIEFRLTDLSETPAFGIPEENPTEGGATEPQSQTVQYTRYVLNNVAVLAVGRNVTSKDDGEQPVTVDSVAQGADQGSVQQTEATPEAISTVYTLALSAEDVERLVFANSQGAIYFTLVPKDYVLTETKGVTIETLFQGDLVEDIFGN